MTTDPRIEAVTNLLKQYNQSGIIMSGTIGWGASVADILAAADAVDPLRVRVATMTADPLESVLGIKLTEEELELVYGDELFHPARALESRDRQITQLRAELAARRVRVDTTPEPPQQQRVTQGVLLYWANLLETVPTPETLKALVRVIREEAARSGPVGDVTPPPEPG